MPTAPTPLTRRIIAPSSLRRLGAVYHEQNKVDEAIATYQKMIDLGGENALRGYQSQVDVYRDAKHVR